MREQLKKIVFETINQFNKSNENQFKIKVDLKTNLIGPNSEIDSVALISLLVSIEDNIKKKLKKNLVIADEKVFGNIKKLKTIGALLKHICSKL